MSDDIYDDDSLNVVQPNEIGASGPLLHAPDAIIAVGDVTHHHGADYGLPDTTVTVVDGVQVVHDGVAYGSGETVDVPSGVAAYWVRSGWATAEPESEHDHEQKSKARTEAPGTSAPPRRQTSPGTRRKPPTSEA